MFRILLKHKLYEFCINLLFDTIGRNFRDLPVNRIKAGDFYESIDFYGKMPWIRDESMMKTFHNCQINKVLNRRIFGEFVTCIAFLSTDYYGEMIMPIELITELRK